VDLREAVARLATIDGSLILVDQFLNHRVDPDVMRSLGQHLAKRLAPRQPGLILTAEASGIPPALACALELGLPMVYAKKFLGTGNRYSFSREVVSPTKGIEYRVEVSRKMLDPGTRVAIVDDFLSGGRTAAALGQIAEEAGCDVVGFAFAIEKAFLGGRARLEDHGWHIDSIVRVLSIEGGVIEIDDD
jgi:xanthine phosphoribosyltransferase